MAMISEEERLRRRQAVQSVLGTNAMEGIFVDAPTLALMSQFEQGEIEIEQFSAAIDLHVRSMDIVRQPATIAAEQTVNAA